MKKLLIIIGILFSFTVFSQVTTDTTFASSQVTYELSWDSSYTVKYINDTNIEVRFEWQLKKYIDGELTKNETHTEVKQIGDKPAYISLLLSPQVVNGIKGILENRKKQLTKSN